MENMIKLTKYVSISSPFNRDFKDKIKSLEGSVWNSATKTWMIPEDKLPEARKAMNETYGYDDTFKTESSDESKED